MSSRRIQKIQRRHPQIPLTADKAENHQRAAKGLVPAALPKMALARDIEVLPSAYFVGKRKPISELPWLWRAVARFIYRQTGWASDHGIESQAICTSREMAEALCAKNKNWFIQELPINIPLPDETVKFKLMTFPQSDAVKMYDRRRAPFVALPSGDVALLDSKFDELEECIEGKCVRA